MAFEKYPFLLSNIWATEGEAFTHKCLNILTWYLLSQEEIEYLQINIYENENAAQVYWNLKLSCLQLTLIFYTVTTSGMNDELEMLNGELYYSLLRVTNALNYTYIIRSDGVTIKQEPLIPGKVYDGDVIGYDLNFLPSKSMVTANWDGFGLPATQLDVESGWLKCHIC